LRNWRHGEEGRRGGWNARETGRRGEGEERVGTRPSKTIEVVPNPNPERDYEVAIEAPEFTCLCPRTGQPDFATIRVNYIPDHLIVELKSFKLYLWSYRDEGAYHEAVVNKILDDLVAAARPRWLKVVGDFNVRGGIHTAVTATYGKPTAP
jgi:7-cyano-7-deazaguanine reductase